MSDDEETLFDQCQVRFHRFNSSQETYKRKKIFLVDAKMNQSNEQRQRAEHVGFILFLLPKEFSKNVLFVDSMKNVDNSPLNYIPIPIVKIHHQENVV